MPRPKKLAKLEAMRGFAAVYVALGHILTGRITGFHTTKVDIILSFFRFGQEAVILFFLLSGFVIQYAYSRSKDKSFKVFFIKRFLRIYVPLLIVFATNAALAHSNHYQISSRDFWNLLGNIFMLQDTYSIKPSVICDTFLRNLPLWSLSYEWWFYMLFFFIENKFKQQASMFVYIAGTIAALTYLFIPNFVNRELMYLIIWWIGADLAKLYLSKEKMEIIKIKTPLFFLVLNIVILFINVKMHKGNSTLIGMSPFLELRHFSFALLVVIGAFLWQRFNWVGFRQTFGIFEKVAPISFGIYISHWFLVVEAHYLDFIGNGFLTTVSYIVICLLFSYLVERVIYVRLNEYVTKKFVKKEELKIKNTASKTTVFM